MFKNDLSSLPDSVMNKDDYTKSFYPVVGADFIVASGIVAIPLEYDALTLYVNDSIFTSALKSAPKTWDDLNQLAKELTQTSPSKVIIQSGVGIGLTENVEYWPEIVGLMMVQNGVNLGKPEGSQVKFALKYFSHFTTEDKVWDASQPVSTVAFSKGKLAMYFAPSYVASEIMKTNPSLRFRTVPLPQLPKEKPSDPDFSYATYWAEAVWKRTSNANIAWDFIKFMSSPESLQKLNLRRKESGRLEKAYPRPEMAVLQKDDKILGSVLALAPFAKSWYLADKTSDGQTGINFQINSIFSDTIDLVSHNRDTDNALKALPGKINTVVSKYNSKK
jgi:ABC-type glycerol-3-phosphate transport system substrate-binding protein